MKKAQLRHSKISTPSTPPSGWIAQLDETYDLQQLLTTT